MHASVILHFYCVPILFFCFPTSGYCDCMSGSLRRTVHLQKLSTDIKYNLIYHKMVTLHVSAFLKPKK